MKAILVTGLLIWAIFCVSFSAQAPTFEQSKERVETRDAFAQAIVAMHYHFKWNTEKNLGQATKYASASAKAWSPLGYFRVGTMI